MPVRWSLIDQVGNEGYDVFYDSSPKSDPRVFCRPTRRTLHRCSEHSRRVLRLFRKSSREKESRTLIMHQFCAGSDISNDIDSRETLTTRLGASTLGRCSDNSTMYRVLRCRSTYVRQPIRRASQRALS